MRTPIYQLDAFTVSLFSGNPAAVMPLLRFLPDPTLQAIAAENNLAETAFLVAEGEDYRLRWFTPAVEVPLCGHATLASAAVVMEKFILGYFQSSLRDCIYLVLFALYSTANGSCQQIRPKRNQSRRDG